jgi:hypothetical protein
MPTKNSVEAKDAGRRAGPLPSKARPLTEGWPV